MAKKKHKKPRHTKLVLPGDTLDSSKKESKYVHKSGSVPIDRIGRKASEDTSVPVKAATPQSKPEKQPPKAEAQKAAGAAKENKKTKPKTQQFPAQKEKPAEKLPDNAVLLPEKRPGLTLAKRKKRKRRIRVLVAVCVVLLLLLAYFSEAYLYAYIGVTNIIDTARVTLQPGEGFPLDFSLPAYRFSQTMGNNAFAALGDKDVAIISSTGREMQRAQHGFVRPNMTAGNTRVCVYNRGGTEYVVEGFNGTIARKNTSQEILFAQMSPGGWLALATASRYQTNLEIYSPLMDDEWQTRLKIVDDKPIGAVFYKDNKTLALACLAAKDGAVGTNIYLLQTNQTVMPEPIRANDALMLQMHFITSNRLLVVFDSYTAIYDNMGNEIARFNYGNEKLTAADTNGEVTALVFASDVQTTGHLVLLDNMLAQVANIKTSSGASPKVMVKEKGVLLLIGQQLVSYSPQGGMLYERNLQQKALDLVDSGTPILMLAGKLESLEEMLQPLPESGSAASKNAGTEAGG